MKTKQDLITRLEKVQTELEAIIMYMDAANKNKAMEYQSEIDLLLTKLN
jgi:hypothetical protein